MSLTSSVSIMLMRHRGRQDGVGGRRLCWWLASWPAPLLYL